MRYAVLGMILLFALGDGCSPPPGVVGVQEYGRVTGRVLDAMTNRPIPGALLSVGSLYTAQADATGAFTIRSVPEGDQTVTARAPGYQTATAPVTVTKDATVSVGYVRLVPLIHPQGENTLPPPPTPVPASPAASGPPAGAPASPQASAAPAAAPPSADQPSPTPGA
jgi:hypothetical protein